MRAELQASVDAYFERTGLDRAGGAPMWGKTLAILLWAGSSYLLLLLWATSWWSAAPLAVSLGLALAAAGFCVMHDGNHGSYGRRRLVNLAAGGVLDLLGGSSYVWKHKHNVLHHTYTNVDGVDDDIELRPFFRLADSQPLRWMHRFQFLYWVPLFALFTTKWILVDDFVALARGKVGRHRMKRPRGLDLAQLLAGKVSFLVWGVTVPLLFVPLVPYLLGYLLVSTVWGVTMGLVFQLAHASEDATFVANPPAGGALERPWVEHQLATTVDFACGNRLLSWYVGGLNFQVEHHLFPRISHRHYPALAPLVREVCRAHGITPHEHPTLWSAVRAHLEFLRRMGRPTAAEPEPLPALAR